MGGILYPFQPVNGSGAAYTTGADAAITNLKGNARQVQITNTHASVICYVRIAPDGAATAADMPVLPGQRVIITKGETEVVGRIFSATAGSAHIICGTGGAV